MVDEIIITDRGLPASVVSFGRPRPERLFGEMTPRRVAVLSQPSVTAVSDRLVAACRALGAEAATKVVPDREAAKSLQVADDVYRWLNSLGLTRDDWVVGVGGGAVTDLTGFVAGTYLRGVHAGLVPTTLLGAVDAAIGGKTAVNVDGKNLVGIFRHPDRVVIDVEVIASAPREVTREGHAEAIKAGLIADPQLFELYESSGENVDLGVVVRRAVAVKAAVVSEDFTEQGRRIILNYGHTVGHALEVASSLPHGHAVSLGMVVAAHIAEREAGFAHSERQNTVLESVGLPVRGPAVSVGAVERLIGLDKKRNHEGLRMVLLEDIGRPIVVPVEATTVLAGLEAIGPH